MRPILMLLAMPLVAGGCLTAQYDAQKPAPTLVPPTETRVSIVTPPDGQDDRPETYKGSGDQTAKALQAVLAKRGIDASVSESTLPTYSFGSHQPAARTLRLTPTIELWSDRVTEWSGKSDELKMHLVLTDRMTGATVDDRTVTAKSKWWTFGGDHPQQMLEDLFSKWADTVFEKPAKK